MKSPPRPILIDTEPGLDDAIALLLAFASPELDLRGILTVAGNVPVPLTTRNALQICELAGKTEVPVYAGCARPLLRHLETAESVHGDNGLADVPLPPPTMPGPPRSRGRLPDRERTGDARHDAVPAGPDDQSRRGADQGTRFAANIGSVVAMGGSFFAGGNSAPALEFNMQVDPHAAHVVMTAGLDVVLAPLDLTHSVLTTDEQLARVAKLPGRIVQGRLGLAELLRRARPQEIRHAGRPAA